LLLVQSHQAEIIVVKRIIQACNKETRVGDEHGSRDCDHTVVVKTAL